MNKNIVLLTSGHPPDDERIFHKIGKSLLRAGNKVTIISSYAEKSGTDSGINFHCFDGNLVSRKQKHKIIYNLLTNIQPDVVISSEVVPVFPVLCYRFLRKPDTVVLLDVTEWYPENVLMKKSHFAKFLYAPLLYFFVFFASLLVDGFLYGEKRKLQRYLLAAPGKPAWFVPYYPLLSLIGQANVNEISPNSLTICYTGILNEERGFRRFLEAAIAFKKKNPQVNLRLLVIGDFVRSNDSDKLLSKMSETSAYAELQIAGRLSYENFLQKLSEADIFLDLREKNFIYNNSLPIKIFDYLAAGKPCIYSDIDALKDIQPIPDCVYLVNPNDLNAIAERMEFYLNNPHIYKQHCLEALRLSRNNFNWEKFEPSLLKIISEI